MVSIPSSITFNRKNTKGGRLRAKNKRIEELPEFRKTLQKAKGGKISAKKLLRFAINPWFGVAGLIADKIKKKKKEPKVLAQKRPRESSTDFTDGELETILNLINTIAPDPETPQTVPLPVKTDGEFNIEDDGDVPPPLPPRDLVGAEPAPPPLPPRDSPEITFAEQLQAQREKLRRVKTAEEKLKDANKEHPLIADMEDKDDDEWGDIDTTQFDPYMDEILQNMEDQEKAAKRPRKQTNEYTSLNPLTSLRIDTDRIKSRRRAIAPEEMSDDETGWGMILKNLRKKRSRGRKTRR